MMFTLCSVLIVAILCVPRFVRATGTSPTRSQNSADIDWRSFLIDSPEHSVYGTSRRTSAPASPNVHHQQDNDPLFQVNQIHSINKQAALTKRKNRKVTEGDSANVNYEQLFAEKQRLRRESVNQRSKRYRASIKQKTGFSSVYNARLNEYRFLEKTGYITLDQQIVLNAYREKMRNHMKTYKMKKQSMDPLAPKPKRGRPPILRVPPDPSLPKRGKGRPPKV